VGARFSAPVQTGPGGPPGKLYNGYQVSFPRVRRPGRGVDYPPPSSAEVKEGVELYLCSPSGPSWPVLGSPLPFTVHTTITIKIVLYSYVLNIVIFMRCIAAVCAVRCEKYVMQSNTIPAISFCLKKCFNYISSYMFRLLYRVIFRLVLRYVVYNITAPTRSLRCNYPLGTMHPIYCIEQAYRYPP
jgi:hypothetical protein